MYKRSRRILAILLLAFVCEIVAIIIIIWQTIGPTSPLTVVEDVLLGEHYCAFSGINVNFIYLLIPFICFESLLLFLAARVFMQNLKRTEDSTDKKGIQVNSFISVLARDSLLYFFINLAACAVVMGLWQSVTALYANICVPFVMLLEIIVGTRLVIEFRERYNRPDRGAIISGKHSSLHFRGDTVQMEPLPSSVGHDVETVTEEARDCQVDWKG